VQSLFQDPNFFQDQNKGRVSGLIGSSRPVPNLG
jgi:hypothetical protein